MTAWAKKYALHMGLTRLQDLNRDVQRALENYVIDHYRERVGWFSTKEDEARDLSNPDAIVASRKQLVINRKVIIERNPVSWDALLEHMQDYVETYGLENPARRERRRSS